MARGRMLNQKVSDDITFNEMSVEHQFFFMRVLPFLDRDGLITGHPILLPSKVIPLMPEQHPKFKEAIQAWIDAGFVIEYSDGKQPVLFFVNFADNQANMRYDRESPSDFPAPPGYKRTSKGLVTDDTPDEPQTDADTENTAEEQAPDDIRQSSGQDPRIRLREDQDQVKGEDQHASACDAHAEQPTAPPLDAVKDEYLPGLPDPRKKKQPHTEVAERFVEAKELGVEAVQYRELVDALLTGLGKKALVDAGDDSALYFAQDLTLTIMRMSEKFRTVEGVQSIFQSWKVDDWRGRKGESPSSKEFKEHASAMVAGLVGATQPVPQATFKQWCLRTYHTDNPQVALGIPDSRLRAEYDQSIRVH